MSYPKTWDEVYLSDLCLEPFANGITLTQQSMGHGAKLVNIVDLYESHTINIHTLGRANASKEQLKKSELKKGDIVFVRSSVKREGAAMCACFPGDKEPVVFGCFNIRFRPQPKLVDPKFLTLFLRSPQGRSRLLNVCQTATITNINQDNLGLVNVPLPPLAEQKRIAAIAQKADQLRRTRRYALQLSDTYLRSVFLEMFGDPITNSMGWDVSRLEEHTKLVSSGSTPLGGSTVYKNYGIRFVRSQNVLMNSLDFSDIAYIDKKTHQSMKRTWVQQGDILLNITGASIGRVAYYSDATMANVNQHVCIIRLDKKSIIPIFLSSLISLPEFQRKIFSAQSGATRQALTFDQIKDFVIIVPPLPLQEKFAQIVQKFDRLRTQQREADRQAEHLFQTILHRAFRGELTSQNADDEPESVLLEDIRAQQAKAEAKAKTATQAMGDAAEYLGTKAKQQDIEPIQLKFPGFE
jgi:type I restriction enzyme S subunit